LHDRLLPLLNYERCYGGTPVYKAVLHRRGVIRTPTMRSPGPGPDGPAQRGLERILADVGGLFKT
jgi:dihydrodipicolinate synthase/N-acetylneuraminate lyase